MQAKVRGLVVAMLLGLGACASQGDERPSVDVLTPAPPPADTSEWRDVARPEDGDRLDRIDAAWRTALAEARARGFRTAVAKEGELLKPDAALPRAAPPPGQYMCRVVKLGTQNKGGPAFAAYKPFYCFVEAEGPLLTIVKQTGTQRPAGRLYPDKDERLIFLGTLALGNEEAPLAYGEDAKRDMAGVVERVAPFRWRLVIPWPRHESKLDVFELVPATQ